MNLHSMFRRLFRSGSRSRPPQIQGLCGPEELEKALRRERSRADRTSGEFAVITFSSGTSSEEPAALYALIEHILERSRSIDELGWNDDGTLWHILPHCSEPSAVSIATTLCQSFSTANEPLVYTLYHYSAEHPGANTPLPDLKSIAAAPNSSVRATTESNGPTAAPIQSAASAQVASHQPAFSVDRLLERPMPRWKRLLDVTASTTALVCLSPLFALIALLIKATSPGPVFFVQMRSGRGGRPFSMYKFRSMVIDAEARKQNLLALNEQDGPAFKMENDPRITRIGRYLRATSLDELPQLWNVLCGQMSLVGPRPLPLSESAACTNWQRQRMDVTPGLTCIWQIKDRRAKIPFVDWARMDIQYAGRRSLGLDLYLIARTVLFVLRRKGV